MMNTEPLPPTHDDGQAWYESWFDSPYYHILYNYRDRFDAKAFIDNLISVLQPRKRSRMLDLACGRGRHAIYLAGRGYEVTGLDLSEKSIRAAQAYEHERLSFFTHDMRKLFRTNYFDYIFNFFTSFGYFDNDKDHLDTLISIRRGLKHGGTFVFDYFNSAHVLEHLVASERRQLEGIDFLIERFATAKQVHKRIRFQAEGRDFQFEENVRLFRPEDLEQLFEAAGLRIVQRFGDYELNPFDAERSPRLIFIAHPA